MVVAKLSVIICIHSGQFIIANLAQGSIFYHGLYHGGVGVECHAASAIIIL